MTPFCKLFLKCMFCFMMSCFHALKMKLLSSMVKMDAGVIRHPNVRYSFGTSP